MASGTLIEGGLVGSAALRALCVAAGFVKVGRKMLLRCEDPNTPLAQHTQQVRRLAAEYGVGLVDSYAAFQRFAAGGGDLSGLMSQPNHPNRRGHELVAEELAPWFLRPSPPFQ